LKPSSAGKYVSFSVKTMMLSADAVIAKYKEVGKIEGVIAL
jgi:putative lipoic acid-binding regulatory protein